MSDQPMMQFDIAKRNRLRKAYDLAVSEGLEQFRFEGHDFVVGYAKYLLEYLDTKLVRGNP